MNERRVMISASLLILIIYLISSVQDDLPVCLISVIPFAGGVLVSLRKGDPFYMIVLSEILVVTGSFLPASLVIQVIAGALFFVFYIASDKYVLMVTYAIFVSVFAWLASGMEIALYAVISLAAVALIYATVTAGWRRFKKMVAVDS